MKTLSVLKVFLVALSMCEDRKPSGAVSDAATALLTDAQPQSRDSVAPTASPGLVSPAPEQIACQHILVAYKGAKNAPHEVTRSRLEALARAKEVRAKAIAGGDFSELAKAYSDDSGSRDRLGSVGKFKREGMVKPFSDAAFALKNGEISEVVETAFGFHVIKRNQ